MSGAAKSTCYTWQSLRSALSGFALVAACAAGFVFAHQHTADLHHDHADHIHTPAKRTLIQSLGLTQTVEAFGLFDLLSGPKVTLANFPMQPVEELAKRIAKDLQPAVKRPIHVVSVNRKELTPLAAVSRNPTMCIVVLNNNPDGWAIWERFFDRVPESERMNVAELSIAHEIGHCVDRENRTASITAPATGRQEIWEGELFADIFATLYANQYMGERGHAAIEALKAIRDEFASQEPTHATGESLKALQPRFDEIRLQRLSATDLVQTASLLKAQQIQ